MRVLARRWGALAAFGLFYVLPKAVTAAEPCKLLTEQEIGQVLGVTVSPAPLGTTGCMWGSGSQRVSIVLRDAAAWARITAPGPHITKTDVNGIGEAAQFSGMDKVWTLSVKQGASVIVLTVYGAKSSDQQRSSEESLARLALRRL
jgi:hypothetical protein